MQQVLFRIRIPDWIPDGNPLFALVFLIALGLVIRALVVRWYAKRGQPFPGHSLDVTLAILGAFLFGGWRGALWARTAIPAGIPIYGFGTMMFVGFVFCTWLASRRAEREGIRKEAVQDLAVYLFVGGIVGARLTSMVTEGVPLQEFYRIWDGGMVLYGAFVGGPVGYVVAYFLVIRPQGLSSWKLADIIAPAVAVGIALGRIGCFLNGCCYGQLACPECVQQVTFPLSSPPRFELVHKGWQTAAGFTLSDDANEPLTVSAVEPGSAAAESGLKKGDVLVKIRDFKVAGEDRPINSYSDLDNDFGRDWPRGKNSLALTVLRGSKEIDLPTFAPRTLGLLPTQLFETISMVLLFFVLTAYLPFRKRPGEVMAVLMFCYGLHRYLNELLRGDKRPEGLETLGSVLLIVAGLGLWIWLRWLATPAQRPLTTNA